MSQDKQSSVVKLEHHYSLLTDFYGVRTSLSMHELNVRCAYIQLLRDELPDLPGAEDVIGEDNGSALLGTIFDMPVVTEPESFRDTLDFYYNWEEHCGHIRKIENDIRSIAKVGAFKAVITDLIKDSRNSISRLREGQFAVDNEDEWIEKVEASIEKLEKIAAGEAVDAAWNWQTLAGDSCTGKIYVRNDNTPDFPDMIPSKTSG